MSSNLTVQPPNKSASICQRNLGGNQSLAHATPFKWWRIAKVAFDGHYFHEQRE